MRYVLVLSFVACQLLIVAPSLGADKAGSADHPMLARYPGFTVRDQAVVEFDEADLIVSPLMKERGGEYHAELLRVEGKVHNTVYFQEGKSVSRLQLYRNYETALKKLGAEILFACAGDACFELSSGSGNGTFFSNYLNRNGRVLNGIQHRIRSDTGILTAKLAQNEKLYHILIVVSADDINENRYINQSIVEADVLDDQKIVISSADEIARMIDMAGKAILDGVYFDHNQATIKPESAATLAAIVDYLRDNGEKSFFVVGHTDSSGEYDYNVTLSERRANAVVDALVDAGVARATLRPVGIGPVAPGGSNRSDTGMANNRRVELVENVRK